MSAALRKSEPREASQVLYRSTWAIDRSQLAPAVQPWSSNVFKFPPVIRHSDIPVSASSRTEYPNLLLAIFASSLTFFFVALVLAGAAWLFDSDWVIYLSMGCFALGAIAFSYSTKKAGQVSSGTTLVASNN